MQETCTPSTREEECLKRTSAEVAPHSKLIFHIVEHLFGCFLQPETSLRDAEPAGHNHNLVNDVRVIPFCYEACFDVRVSLDKLLNFLHTISPSSALFADNATSPVVRLAGALQLHNPECNCIQMTAEGLSWHARGGTWHKQKAARQLP